MRTANPKNKRSRWKNSKVRARTARTSRHAF